MAVVDDRRITVNILLLLIFVVSSAQLEYNVPDVTIEVYKPKGIKVSAPYIPDLRDFSFHANVNEGIDILTKGTIHGSLVEASNGRLEFVYKEVKLKIGDVLNYRLSVSINGQLGSFADLGLKYTVTVVRLAGKNVTEKHPERKSSRQYLVAGSLARSLPSSMEQFMSQAATRRLAVSRNMDYLHNYASGVMKIAAARGNEQLTLNGDRYDNGVLYGGPIMDVQCRRQLLVTKAVDGLWGDDFHEYSLTWTPNYISMSVDGEEWAHIKPTTSLLSRFPRSCPDLPRDKLQRGTKLAPFDDHFYITLGVATGGVTEFPDESYSSGGRPKPWRDAARKGMLNFWEGLPTWEKTWNEPRLIIDYVKVVAL